MRNDNAYEHYEAEDRTTKFRLNRSGEHCTTYTAAWDWKPTYSFCTGVRHFIYTFRSSNELINFNKLSSHIH